MYSLCYSSQDIHRSLVKNCFVTGFCGAGSTANGKKTGAVLLKIGIRLAAVFRYHEETLLCMLAFYCSLPRQRTKLCVYVLEQRLFGLPFPHAFMFSTLYRRVLLQAVERVGVGDVVLAGVL